MLMRGCKYGPKLSKDTVSFFADIVNEQVVPFLEVTSSNDLIQLLNDISDEAGNISKSVIKEDIDELQDKIQSTIQKINAAQEAGKK